MSAANTAQINTIEAFLEASAKNTLLRLSTAGSVDDGKSTLIGRLLVDSKNIYDDHLRAIHGKEGSEDNKEGLALALLTDGLKDEREQGITIDVAYRYFSTPKRRFILADTPGHEQYTRNMATGSSTADLTILLVDARKGVLIQTKRHAFIASLLGVPRFLVAINKMDLVDFQESVFEQIRADFTEFSSKLGVREIKFVPVAALHGDNIVTRSKNMPWYQGESIMEYLENVYVGGDGNQVDFRFPVQGTLRPHQNYRGYTGQIRSGSVAVGDEITVLPSLKKSKIKSIDVFGKPGLPEAHAPQSVTLTLENEIDIARGDMIVRSLNLPAIQNQFEAMVVWMSDAALDLTRPYLVQHTTRQCKIFVEEVRYKVDVTTLHRQPGAPLELNEIGRLRLTSAQPLFLDSYQKNRATGNFILIDAINFQTVAAGMVIERGATDVHEAPSGTKVVSQNLHIEEGVIGRQDREKKFGHPAHTLWCTGLSGSGKSTIAKLVEQRLFADGQPVYRLDGDNLRFGLNRDLGFSHEDRKENIRRVAEVAKLFNQAGVSVICSFISPYEEDRAQAREIIGRESFIEIYLATPIDVCEQRDPNGLYKKARSGQIKEFTGISAPYEVPRNPDISVDTSSLDPEQAAELVYKLLRGKK